MNIDEDEIIADSGDINNAAEDANNNIGVPAVNSARFSPAPWIRVAKSQFRLHCILSQLDKFSIIITVLLEPSAWRIAHLLADPGDDCYTILKTELLAAQPCRRLSSSFP